MTDAATISTTAMAERKRNITDTINAYSKRLMGFIRKRVDNEADAEDILQDVFYQFVGNTQPIEQLTAWFFTVTRNKITDKKRKKKPDSVEDIYTSEDGETIAEWTELFSEGNENPETAYLRSLFWEALDSALKELPKEQRDVFILNELEGVPFKEIAEQTGETVNTLISRKRYAVLHLRDRLGTLKDELLNS
ncbi:RNA polymerase sigma factor [Pinibacter aurantiacus]|uniref:Sigma-70 family RNA polymerase sigma factor n=1 Tax=Pinibacter aurantiacus TaxID=2851599 RepID=A0A9E2SAU7_9BACT|nr:sigma-70 family RNA polymerase sigma factor [Pinibacter aurantiacus]MBV4357907.1 sigma-70 family RNA polymerase sigma factor [Pinibacter aurantiacus]